MRINPNTAIVIFIIIFIIAAFAAMMVPPGAYDDCRLKTFVTVFAGLSLLLTVVFYYAVIQLQVTQSELLELRETQNVQDSITAATASISKGVDFAPQFCAQLLPLQTPSFGTVPDRPSLKQTVTEYEMSSTIFNAFQIAVLEQKFVCEQEDFYLCLFLQWATSPILYRYWRGGKISLVPKTQAFGDLLFAYAPQEDLHNPRAYEVAAQKLRANKKYQCIFYCNKHAK